MGQLLYLSAGSDNNLEHNLKFYKNFEISTYNIHMYYTLSSHNSVYYLKQCQNTLKQEQKHIYFLFNLY